MRPQAKSVSLVVAAIMLIGAMAPVVSGKGAKKPVSGETVFKQMCASCHAGGGNSVNSKHPLAGSKQLATVATFKEYLSAPPGHMPYYQSVVNDKKTLEALYQYCKKLTTPVNSAQSAPNETGTNLEG